MISKPVSVRIAGWFFLLFILGSLTAARIVARVSPEHAAFVPSHFMFVVGLICGLWWLVGTAIYRWRVRRKSPLRKDSTGK